MPGGSSSSLKTSSAKISSIEVLRIALPHISIPEARFAFVRTGEQQTTATVASKLAELRVETLTLDTIYASLDYLPLNKGEAWGHLRIFPRDNDDLLPTDIPVFDELPLDLSVVAGVLTRAVQDTNSHVNLKSKERNTPNAVLRTAEPKNPRLADFADKPVHLIVGAEDFTVELTTEEVVAQKLAEQMNRPLVTMRWEPEHLLRSYDEMATGSAARTLVHARRYGSESGQSRISGAPRRFGRVTDAGSPSARMGYDLVPRGFGIPLQMYRDFVEHPPNQKLRDLIDDLVTSEQSGNLSPRTRKHKCQQVQDAFMAASFPDGAWEKIRAKLDEVIPGLPKIKVRSSANSEDVPNFGGAGLHDSYAADPRKSDLSDKPCQVVSDADDDGGEVKRKVKPKSVACAVRGVYASLWNRRAVEERSLARIDQSTIAMGLAVVDAYDNESEIAANAVALTHVRGVDMYGYSLSIQEGNNVVTNPAPGSHSELTVATFFDDKIPPTFSVTRFAKPTPDAPQRTSRILSDAQMKALVDLIKKVERAYCAAKPDYYLNGCEFVAGDANKVRALDLEIKLKQSGQLVYKQVRESRG